MVQGNQITDEPQFISPTDVVIVPEPEGAAPEPAEDLAIRLPVLAEPLPVMEEVTQLMEPTPEEAQPEQAWQSEGGLQRSTRQKRGVRQCHL
jgi:hypothetical protein